MKEQAIQKINKVGKAGHIVTLVCRIVLIVGIAALAIGMIVMAFVPRGALTLQSKAEATFQIDLNAMNRSLSKEQVDRINRGDTGYYSFAYIESSGRQYDMTEISATTEGVLVKGDGEETTLDLHRLSYTLLPVLITLVCALVCMIFAGRLCKAFHRCETPFEENVIQKLQQLAYSLVPWTVFSSLADGTIDSLLTGQLRLYFNINVGMIVTVLLVFLLVVVFKYGAVLQQESDETL